MDYSTDRYRGLARLLMTCDSGMKDALILAVRRQIEVEAERYRAVQRHLDALAG